MQAPKTDSSLTRKCRLLTRKPRASTNEDSSTAPLPPDFVTTFPASSEMAPPAKDGSLASTHQNAPAQPAAAHASVSPGGKFEITMFDTRKLARAQMHQVTAMRSTMNAATLHDAQPRVYTVAQCFRLHTLRTMEHIQLLPVQLRLQPMSSK